MTVADKEQLAILKQGVDVWNKWREENPYVVTNLSGAKLNDADLNNADLQGADLQGAQLSKPQEYKPGRDEPDERSFDELQNPWNICQGSET